MNFQNVMTLFYVIYCTTISNYTVRLSEFDRFEKHMLLLKKLTIFIQLLQNFVKISYSWVPYFD